MKILYLGSGRFGLDCLIALNNSDNDLSLIVTSPALPAGRGKKMRPTPVANWAKDNNIDVLEAKDANAPESIEKIAALAPDLIVVIAFGQKISNELINLPPKGTINVHASLLPKYRGAAPINWPIINGETETGISIITLAEKMDAGDILSQAKTDIIPGETAGHLHDRLAQLAAPLLLETIEKIAAGLAVYTPQDHLKATIAPKLKKSDGRLDFNWPAETIRRKILGLWPWPEACCLYVAKETAKEKRIIIADAQVIESANPCGLEVGTLDENLNIICAKDALKIIKLKPAGGRIMDFKDFVNGHHVRSGDLFTAISD